MATSNTSQSAQLSGAAKDDSLGADGDFMFGISDLLANDPGGAAKVSISSQFLFGSTQEDWDDQAGYLADHGIIDNGDGTFSLTEDAIDFQYMVQIGNRGTWSLADVDVTAPVVVEPHAGDLLFNESFENYDDVTTAPGDDGWEPVDLAAGGWTSTGNDTEVVWGGGDDPGEPPAYNGLAASDGNYWLDTQATSGPIAISHDFNDPTGGQVQISLDIAFEDFGGGTGANAEFEIRLDDDVVDTITTAELLALGPANQMHTVEYVVNTGAVGSHTLTLTDLSTPSNIGFAIDNIQIHDWIV